MKMRYAGLILALALLVALVGTAGAQGIGDSSQGAIKLVMGSSGAKPSADQGAGGAQAGVSCDRSCLTDVQQKLSDQGLYKGDINGKMNSDTGRAIKQFQSQQGMPASGQLDQPTLSALNVQPSAGRGGMEQAAPGSEQEKGGPQAPAASPNQGQGSAPSDSSTNKGGASSQSSTIDLNKAGGVQLIADPVIPPQGSPAAQDVLGAPQGAGRGAGAPSCDKSCLMDVQQSLCNKGLYKGSIDGKIGPGTSAAIKKFQSQQGLTASGHIDQQTLSALNIQPSGQGGAAPSPKASGAKAPGTPSDGGQ
jgi:peptidoglycan hydrolase-like protein with peptidoglycan-binding domain